MHASQGAFSLAESDVCLSNYRIQTVLSELVLTKGAGKETSAINVLFDINDEGARQVGFTKSHHASFKALTCWEITLLGLERRRMPSNCSLHGN